MTFLLVGITLDVAQVLGLIFIFVHYLDGVDLSGWGFSSSISLTLLGDLGRRLISRRGGMGLSLVFTFRDLVTVLPIGVFFVFLD